MRLTSLIEDMERFAKEKNVPIMQKEGINYLKQYINTNKINDILEIGTAVGYSASMFAKSTDEDCIIDTIEIDEERAKEAEENIKKIGVAERINIMVGNAVDILPTLTNAYDIVFIDAAKGKYPIFLENAIRLIKDGGIILADNILYKGYVMSDYNAHKQRTAVRHLREYIKEITENDKCESEILEIGDGLAITKVRK